MPVLLVSDTSVLIDLQRGAILENSLPATVLQHDKVAEHQNISAVLVNFRQPFIAGYLPRQNYQKLLEQAVLEWLSTEPRFFERLADGPVLMPRARPAIETGVRVTSLIEKPPDGAVDADPGEAVERSARFYRTDFVRRDAENRQLGRLGEE
jgi:hypothetical protein